MGSSDSSFLSAENGNEGGRQRETRWLTPKYLVEALGEFDLDPCGAPGWDLAKKTYLLENGDNGLVDPWEGRVWCNPPYGREALPFMKKMVEHGHGTALIFARVETKLFMEQVWRDSTAILFLQGRLTFLRADGIKATAPAAAPSALVAYGSEDARALAYSGLPGRLVLTNKTLVPRKRES